MLSDFSPVFRSSGKREQRIGKQDRKEDEEKRGTSSISRLSVLIYSQPNAEYAGLHFVCSGSAETTRLDNAY